MMVKELHPILLKLTSINAMMIKEMNRNGNGNGNNGRRDQMIIYF